MIRQNPTDDQTRQAENSGNLFSTLEWFVARRYLRPQRRGSFIAVISIFSFLGIMLGVATLIIVMSVMNGFRIELLDRILGVRGHLVIHSYSDPIRDYGSLVGQIGKIPGVRAAVPQVEGQVLVTGAGGSSGALVHGARAPDIAAIPFIGGSVMVGSLDGWDDGDGMLIGRRLAQTHGIGVGDRLTLIAPDGAITPFGTTPRVKGYEIAAIFDSGMSEYDSSFVYLPMPEAQRFFNMGESVSSIEVFTEDPDRIEDIRDKVVSELPPELAIVDWRERDASFFSALRVERNVMFVILTLIIAVAALNIVSGLTMLVREKRSDIAVLRTIGVTRGAILRIFLMVGASIGILGTLIGTLLGVVVCLNVESIRLFLSDVFLAELFPPEFYFLSQLPAVVNPNEVAMVVTIALGLAFLATVFPAWRAATLDPVEALRHD